MNELWVVKYFNKEETFETETREEAVDLFIEGFTDKNKGTWDKKGMKQIIMTGVPKLEYETDACFVYQLCLPNEVYTLLGGQLVERLSELDALASSIQYEHKKLKKEFYHKGFLLSHLLGNLESTFESKALRFLRVRVERLWSDAESSWKHKGFKFDSDTFDLVLKAYLSTEVE